MARILRIDHQRYELLGIYKRNLQARLRFRPMVRVDKQAIEIYIFNIRVTVDRSPRCAIRALSISALMVMSDVNLYNLPLSENKFSRRENIRLTSDCTDEKLVTT